jgi:DNA-binding NtrC family response regulator
VYVVSFLINNYTLSIMSNKIKIFILDGNRYFGKLIEDKLIAEHREVRYFQTEMELIRRIDEKPEILILDHRLEHCTGLEILEVVKRRCGSATNVIYLSAQEYLNITLKALRNGAVEYIEKGITPLKYLNSVILKIEMHTEKFTKPLNIDLYRSDSRNYDEVNYN